MLTRWDAAFTTTLAGNGIEPCNQAMTLNSTMGSAMAVCPSYQLSYSALPYDAASKYSGMTFKRQWATALRDSPQNIFMSSFNEYLAQPQPNPYSNPLAVAMGLPNDTERQELWVDTYGWHIGRDIEPSVQGGDTVMRIMDSCMRVMQALAWAQGNGLARPSQVPGTTAACPVAGEMCCEVDPTRDLWNDVWSFHDPGGAYMPRML